MHETLQSRPRLFPARAFPDNQYSPAGGNERFMLFPVTFLVAGEF